MSEAKHTPGPWQAKARVERYSDGDVSTAVYVVSAATNKQVLEGFGVGYTLDAEIKQKIANSLLIAASPDLLAVVKELLASAEYWGEYDVPLGIVDRMKAAVEKAEPGYFEKESDNGNEEI